MYDNRYVKEWCGYLEDFLSTVSLCKFPTGQKLLRNIYACAQIVKLIIFCCHDVASMTEMNDEKYNTHTQTQLIPISLMSPKNLAE